MSDSSELAEAAQRTSLALRAAKRAVLASDSAGLASALTELEEAANAQAVTAAILERTAPSE